MQTHEGLLSIEDARHYLNPDKPPSRNTFVELDIPFIQIGKRKMYRPMTLDKWLQQSEKTPCRYEKEKVPHTTGMPSHSRVRGLGEALAHLT